MIERIMLVIAGGIIVGRLIYCVWVGAPKLAERRFDPAIAQTVRLERGGNL